MKKTILRVVALALLAVMMCTALVACAPASDPDKAIEALEKNDYKAGKDDTVIPAVLDAIDVEGVDCVVIGAEGKTDLALLDPDVVIVYFKDSASAKDAYEAIEKEWGDDADVIKRSGKMIYWGDEDAVKAAR